MTKDVNIFDVVFIKSSNHGLPSGRYCYKIYTVFVIAIFIISCAHW